MRKSILLLALIVALATPSSAAIIYLKDGSRVRGTVVSATARDLRVHTDNGTLTIDVEKISRVDYTETAAPEGGPPSEPSTPVRRARMDAAPERAREDLRQMFSINLGFANPLSRVDFSSTGGGTGDNGDTGFVLGTQYHYFTSPRLGVGMNLEYVNRSRNSSQSLLPSANTDVHGSSLLLLGTLRYSLSTRGTVRPYLLAGLGTNRTSTIAEATPNAGFAWSDTSTNETRTLVDDSRWGLATTARFGLDFMLADPASFSLEFGWTGISNSDYTATVAGKDLGLEKVKGDLDLLTVAARWGWRF